MFAVYSFSLGIFSVGLWPALPGFIESSGILVACLFLYLFRFKITFWLMLGILYGACWGQYVMSHQLPDEMSPSDVLVIGEVVGLPVVDGHRVRFQLSA